jgi:glycerol uptake facilitator-like aquaporin
LQRRFAAEAIGSLLLAATVIGSGVMAEWLSGANTAVALLANTGATVGILIVLIRLLGPVSGAHFNPVVSLVLVLRRSMTWREAPVYALAQITGCCRSEDAPWMVGGWIGAAYWFTSSTAFANPAITVARALSDTFAGIRPEDVPGFVAAQAAGGLAGFAVARWLFLAPRASEFARLIP